MRDRIQITGRILAALAILCGALWGPGPLAARAGQDDDESIGVDGTTYESPSWGYTLEWDDDDWQVESSTSEDDADVLFLNGDDGGLFIQGIPYSNDVEDCRDELADILSEEDGVDDWQPLDDEDGDPIADEDEDRAFAAFSLTFTDEDGDDEERVNYIECRTLIEDEAILITLLIAPFDDYEDAFEAAEPVLDSIALAGGADEDEDDDGDRDDDRAGSSDDEFVSEKYGVSLTWEAPWEVTLQIISGNPEDVDQVVLTNGTSTIILSGVTGYDGDAEDCLAAMEEVIRDDRDNDDVEIGEDEDGDPILEEDDDLSFALFTFDRDRGGVVPAPPDSPGAFTGPSGETTHYVECRSLGDESVLIVGHDAPLDEYEDEAEAREDLLDGLEIEPVADGRVESDEESGGIASCETWFIETKARMTASLEFAPPISQSATIPEAIEFAAGYRELAEEQAESEPPAEAEDLNELAVDYLEAWAGYWEAESEFLQNPSSTSLLLTATELLTEAIDLHQQLLITSQLVAADCGLDEREFLLP